MPAFCAVVCISMVAVVLYCVYTGRVQNSTVQYCTIRYGTVRVYIPKNMRLLRGLAARTNHVRFNVAMPIDTCLSMEYRCSVRVRCLLYVV